MSDNDIFDSYHKMRQLLSNLYFWQNSCVKTTSKYQREKFCLDTIEKTKFEKTKKSGIQLCLST